MLCRHREQARSHIGFVYPLTPPYQITPKPPSKVAFDPPAHRALMALPESPGTRRGMTHVD
ncbi:hypothetical protein EMIT0194P_80039 [Pseudomonas serbica]